MPYDINVIQSNEVGSSYHMEKEGLVRGLDFFKRNDLSIELLVTDRHKQINAWLRNNLPDTQHRYDVWHVAKCKTINIGLLVTVLIYIFIH